MKKYYLIGTIIFFCSVLLNAQQQGGNFENDINKLRDDTFKVNRLNELAAKFKYTDPVKATVIVQSAITLSEKINYSFGLSAAYVLQSSLLVNQMKLDSGKLFADKAFTLLKGSKDLQSRDQVGILTNTYGVIYQNRQLYDSAVEKYIEAAKIFKETGNEPRIFYTYHNLSVIYTFLDDSVKMIMYAKAAQHVAVNTADTNLILTGLQLLSNAYDKTKKFDSVLVTANKGLLLSASQNDLFSIGKFHQYLGIAFMKEDKHYDSSLVHLNEAQSFLTKVNSQYDVAVNLHYTGRTYQMMKNYTEAIHFFKKAIELQKKLHLDQLLLFSLNSLVEAEQQAGNINEAFSHLQEFVAINDSLQKRNNRKLTDELETKYQTQRKETLLLAQQYSIRQKRALNYILAASAAAILIISLLSYRSYKQKQKIQKQRINELETQQQLTATEAVLKGEEQERTRLAKDLHDGLGGMLSGIKYSLNTMKENLIMTPDNAQAFERSIDMLDSSIKEMRRVAHNMMPETLVKFGLDAALKDFCTDINKTGAINLSCQTLGLAEAVIDQATSVAIYRIVQELINNTIKHAAAKNAIIQISKNDSLLSITVEDDGKGFDTKILQTVKGIGWSNIQSRVEYLKGKLDCQSEPGKGTSILIELNV